MEGVRRLKAADGSERWLTPRRRPASRGAARMLVTAAIAFVAAGCGASETLAQHCAQQKNRADKRCLDKVLHEVGQPTLEEKEAERQQDARKNQEAQKQEEEGQHEASREAERLHAKESGE